MQRNKQNCYLVSNNTNVYTEKSYHKTEVSAYKKTKRNKIIREILLEYSITPPGRIRDSFVDRILYDDTSGIDPAVCIIIKKELERQNLIV